MNSIIESIKNIIGFNPEKPLKNEIIEKLINIIQAHGLIAFI